jgi:hypothetical protein
LVIDPLVTVISSKEKFAVNSFDVNNKSIAISLLVLPSVTPGVTLVIVIVGPTLSYVQLNWVAAVFPFEAASVNLSFATSIVQAPVTVGVKVAV